MTPDEQRRLPWLVHGKDHALTGLTDVLARLDEAIASGRHASHVTDGEYGWTSAIVVLQREVFFRNALLVRGLMITVQIHPDLIGSDPPERIVREVLAGIADAPRVGEPPRPEEGGWQLDSLLLAESLGMPTMREHLHSSITSATPLGTGGLGVSMPTQPNMETCPTRCIAGPVEVTLAGPFQAENGTRDELEIFAFEHALNTKPIDAIARMRLEERVVRRLEDSE